jgi:hypothetical protein
MFRTQRTGVVCCASLTLALISGCDDTPNPNFEKEVMAAYMESNGDRYLVLEHFPRQRWYMHVRPEDRLSAAQEQSLSFSTAYRMSLELLDAEPQEHALRELTESCRPVYGQVQPFRTETPEPPVAAAEALIAKLKDCRDRSIAAEESNDGKAEERAIVLKRLASTGMVLVSASVVAKGQTEEGLRLWKAAEPLATQDKPGFKVDARNVLGGG